MSSVTVRGVACGSDTLERPPPLAVWSLLQNPALAAEHTAIRPHVEVVKRPDAMDPPALARARFRPRQAECGNHAQGPSAPAGGPRAGVASASVGLDAIARTVARPSPAACGRPRHNKLDGDEADAETAFTGGID